MLNRRIFAKAIAALPAFGAAPVQAAFASPVLLGTAKGTIETIQKYAEADEWQIADPSDEGSDDYLKPIREAFYQNKLTFEQIYESASRDVQQRYSLNELDTDLLANKSMSFAAKVIVQRNRMIERRIMYMLSPTKESGEYTLRSLAQKLLNPDSEVKKAPPSVGGSKGKSRPHNY